MEHEKSSGYGTTKQHQEKYYQYKMTLYWADNIAKFKESYASKKDFYGKVKPGQGTVSM